VAYDFPDGQQTGYPEQIQQQEDNQKINKNEKPRGTNFLQNSGDSDGKMFAKRRPHERSSYACAENDNRNPQSISFRYHAVKSIKNIDVCRQNKDYHENYKCRIHTSSFY
jgi:hypothetical protein